MNAYSPRRASNRWLDGDCPAGVLAIFDNGGPEKRNGSLDRYTILYADADTDHRGDAWIDVLFSSVTGSFSGHEQMRAHEAAEYRRRVHRQSCRWTDLPDAVKATVRRDLAH
jgi:hypothetical protein